MMNQKINELVLFQNTFVDFFEFYYNNNTYKFVYITACYKATLNIIKNDTKL